MRLLRCAQLGAAAVTLAVVAAPAAAAAAPRPATSPTATVRTSCADGLTIILSNIAADDSATDPVTFSITLPSGGVDQVTVRADQIKKQSYAVSQVAAGPVTIAAPGMTTQTTSYADTCTKVLGEKFTRKATKATPGASTLPFTGGWEWALALLGAVLVAAGVVLMRVRSRRAA